MEEGISEGFFEVLWQFLGIFCGSTENKARATLVSHSEVS